MSKVIASAAIRGAHKIVGKAEAKLKELTGQDFGLDAEAWREWAEANWRKR